MKEKEGLERSEAWRAIAIVRVGVVLLSSFPQVVPEREQDEGR